MQQLSEIMMQEKQNLLQLIYRDPGITAYNRLEPRPRSENFERSLRAEVRDALWFITRQWQMGELDAEDCGSAIDARLITKHIHVDRIAIQGNEGKAYNEEIPMEALVERELIQFTLTLKIQVAQYFLQLHSIALRSKYLPLYLPKFGLEKNKEEDFKGQVDGLNLYVATRNRALDGKKIYDSIINNDFKTTVPIDTPDEGEIDKIIKKLKAWFVRQYLHPSSPTDSAWNPQQLDYQFSIAAPDSDTTQVVLRADHYYQGRIDWYDFEKQLNAPALSTDNPDLTLKIEENNPISFIPTPTAFKGMPNPRFWEMEERQINFGKLNAKTSDHLLLVFAEFGLVYGNDWFVIPYKMPVNTLCEIRGFVVTDVFGERTLIQASDEGEDNIWQRWSMFNISNKDHMGSYNRQFFLPSTLTQNQQSDPVEKVNFIRDEMANLVWGIEDIIPDATNKGINGYEASDKSQFLSPPVPVSAASIRYLLGTTVPENWIPFIPVHKPGSNQGIFFQRASMPKLGMPPKDVIKAKGVILNEVPTPYYINEEEIPYSGTIVTRSYQRTRWFNGKTYLWMGRRKETGRGQGSSGLRFDIIEDKI